MVLLSGLGAVLSHFAVGQTRQFAWRTIRNVFRTPAVLSQSEDASNTEARRLSRPDGNRVYLAEAAGRERSRR